MVLPDLKTPVIWILAIACIALAGTAAVERTMAAKAKENLANEKLSRERENNERNRTALRAAEANITKLAAHTATQTEIANALAETQKLVVAGAARNRVLNDRVQRTADQLAAALARADARAEPTAGADQEHRPDPFAALLAEGGILLAEAGRVVAEGVETVGRRDGEVKALAEIIDNDRALARPVSEAIVPAATPAGGPVTRFPRWFE